MNVDEALQHALALQRAGKLQNAIAAYEAILQVNARQIDALHLLGLAKSSVHETDQAIELISRAISICPTSPLLHCNLGVILKQSGRLELAVAAYRRALALDPNSAEIHLNLGKALKGLGQFSEAEKELRTSIRLQPNHASAWCSLLNLVAEEQDESIALALAEEARNCCPLNSDVAMNLGVIQKRCQRYEAAIASFKAAIDLNPRHIEACCKLSALYIQRNEFMAAEQWLHRAEQLDPCNVHVLNTSGLLYNTRGEAAAAEAVLAKTIAIYADNATAHANLGLALKRQGRLSEALLNMQRAHELDPKSLEPLLNMGGVLIGLGRLAEAESYLRGAIRLRGSCKQASDSLLMCLQYRPDVSPEQLLREHRQFGLAYTRPLHPGRSAADSANSRTIRVGFVSADLGEHPVGFFTIRLFEALRRQTPQRLTTYIYSDRQGCDSLAAAVKQSVTKWCDVAGVDDAALAEKIRGDQIDILFDLAGHTAHNRLLVFAERAAPIQISWAGYVGTTGLAQMDYVLADRFHVPIDHEWQFTERVLRMPHGYVTFKPPQNVPDVSLLPARNAGFVRFAAMCNPAKVNPSLLELWAQILQRVPGSRLLLCYAGWLDNANQQRVRDVFSGFGVAQQVEFAYEHSATALMRRYQNVDLALDTFPYSGGLTTCEALWMGVPTITIPGNRFAGRHALSHLSNVGLHDWIATSLGDYAEKAVYWATHLEYLAELRAGLRDRVLASPLCDGPQFATDFCHLLQSLMTAAKSD